MQRRRVRPDVGLELERLTRQHHRYPVLADGAAEQHAIDPAGDAGKALVYVAVVALLILPALDLGLALYRPETERLAAQVTDQVNAYNDLARVPGTFCSYGALP